MVRGSHKISIFAYLVWNRTNFVFCNKWRRAPGTGVHHALCRLHFGMRSHYGILFQNTFSPVNYYHLLCCLEFDYQSRGNFADRILSVAWKPQNKSARWQAFLIIAQISRNAQKRKKCLAVECESISSCKEQTLRHRLTRVYKKQGRYFY